MKRIPAYLGRVLPELAEQHETIHSGYKPVVGIIMINRQRYNGSRTAADVQIVEVRLGLGGGSQQPGRPRKQHSRGHIELRFGDSRGLYFNRAEAAMPFWSGSRSG
ncbi:MAG: hypothetical protein ACJ8F7_14985 [Gemmataceae bacterium]